MNKQICSYYKEDMNMKRKIILAVIAAALILCITFVIEVNVSF